MNTIVHPKLSDTEAKILTALRRGERNPVKLAKAGDIANSNGATNVWARLYSFRVTDVPPPPVKHRIFRRAEG